MSKAKEVKPVTINFFYLIFNGGDGSASVRFYRTQEAYDLACEEQENSDEPDFAEICGSHVSFPVDPKTGEMVVIPGLSRYSYRFEEDREAAE